MPMTEAAISGNVNFPSAEFDTALQDGLLTLRARGDWRAAFLGKIDTQLRDFEDDSQGRDILIDVSGVSTLDTAGAMVLKRVMLACKKRTLRSAFIGASPEHDVLLRDIERHLAPCPVEPVRPNAAMAMMNSIGHSAVETYFAALEVLSFIGVVLVSAARVLRSPRRIRAISTVYHMEEAGLNAVPIVGLMAFLIGCVVAFMGAKILRQFGAEIFVVDLIGVAVLREFGVLLAAILIAGRSGSSFTAQIGVMKIREEIDALRVLGLDPIEVLVLPRIFALVVMMPVLALIGALLGLIGGGLVSWWSLDISPTLFLARTREAIVTSNFWVGLIKAPFFAFVIGVIGCFQGLEVEGSAESLGRRVTLAVVQSLFLVIVIDAFFAMFFLEIDF